MKTISVNVGTQGRAGMPVVRRHPEPAPVRRYARPLPVVAGLPEPSCVTGTRYAEARHVRSIWMPPEGDRLGEKLMLLALSAAAVIGIVQGVSFLMKYVENSAVIHEAMARLLQ